jgi:hypothetical protein
MSAEVAVDRHPLDSVTDAGKLRQIVSSARQDDGTELTVSRYGDAVWDFWPSIPAGNIVPSEKRLNWALSLPDGRTLLDPEHAVLLASAKDFIYSLLLDPVEGRRPPKAQTVVKKLRKGQPTRGSRACRAQPTAPRRAAECSKALSLPGPPLRRDRRPGQRVAESRPQGLRGRVGHSRSRWSVVESS